MPIIKPLRTVPENEADDLGVPVAVRKLPNTTEAEKVIRMKARLKHYGVKNIFNVNDIAGLTAQRDAHNAVIARAQQRIDETPRVPQDLRSGFVVGEYKYSNWVPYPHYEFSPRVPYKHVVKARAVDGRLGFSIANETLDGIAIGPLAYHPTKVHYLSILPITEYTDVDGGLNLELLKQEIRKLSKEDN